MAGTRWLLVGVIVAGAAVGVGIGAVADGTDPLAVRATVSYHDCPAGAVEGELGGGDRVFVTARDDSGDWLEVRSPRDRGGRVWIEAKFVAADSSTEDLDVRSCEPRGDLVLAPVTDTTTTTTAPEPGGPGPADTTKPVIASASVAPADIWEQDGGGITCDPATHPRQATVSANATDASGIASLTASWSFGSVNQTKNIPATFGPFPYLTIPDNTTQTITIVITARDRAGNSSTTTRQIRLHSTAECFI